MKVVVRGGEDSRIETLNKVVAVLGISVLALVLAAFAFV
jgi:hypothetical protein